MTLTETARRDQRARTRDTAVPAPAPPPSPETAAIRPWHFFLLTTISLTAATVVIVRGQSPAVVVLAAFTVAAAGYAGYMVFGMLRPFVSEPGGETTVMLGGRTRAALEREKFLVLRSLKELEFDHRMGKVADADFAEMRDRLRTRAIGLMKQLEGGAAYRAQIEHDLAGRLPPSAEAAPAPGCASCGTANDPDARFCKMCGQAVRA